ncbi:MAG: arginine--tRNA ligase [Acidobacteriota bacterium]|nr:MAG: arginine--tRNA ligase [Acidobacteriota bacterium]
MILIVRKKIRTAIADHLSREGVQFDPSVLQFEHPPSLDLGDIAVTTFPLAKILKKPPKAIAEELSSVVASVEGVSRVEAAGKGYLNIFLERGAALRALHDSVAHPTKPAARAGKIIVEHTAINPNKAAHVGHLRNAVLGDTWVRLLGASGEKVEVQNLIDDLGVQVADVVNGFIHYEKKSLEEVKKIPDLDDYCWVLYAKANPESAFEAGEGRERPAEYPEDWAGLRKSALKALEEGAEPETFYASYITHEIARSHLSLMESLNIRYDLLVWESDILRNELWERSFEALKASGKIILEREGENEGCWVVPLRKSPAFKHLDDPDKILVRSDGTATYVAKDIAYQMWKFGIGGVEFPYGPFGDFEGLHQEKLWRTASPPKASPKGAPSFGKAAKVYNVIDVRQEYLQKIVAESLRVAGFGKSADNSVHFSYEMVALTPRTAEELGFRLTDEERKKPYVEMSGRRGIGIKAKDLLEKLRDKAAVEVGKRNPGFTDDEVAKTAWRIAVAALRYFMLRFTRNKVVAFDIDEAVQFEGETGPYLQYSAVRVKNIFQKCAEAWGKTPDEIRAEAEAALDGTQGWLLDDTAWQLLLTMSRLEDAVGQAVRSEEPSVFARYAFTLAQHWNSFYHVNPVLQEKDEAIRGQRLALASLFERRMTRVLALLGIEVPERM